MMSDEVGIEEETLAGLDDEGLISEPATSGLNSKSDGTIMIPRIRPRGVTVDRLLGKKAAVNGNIEMIAVKDDRLGALQRLGRKHYLQLIMPLHVELLKIQNWLKEKGLRVVFLFEGQDAAGKGGTIKRFIEHMNPRGCRVVALDKPTDEERGQWYFQRYVRHLPTEGEIVLFDRSWYRNSAAISKCASFCDRRPSSNGC